MTTLADLVTTELDRRGWSMRELARRAGISHAQISYVVSGTAKPSADFCVAIARALHIPPEKTLRLGGFLPPLPEGKEDAVTKELVEVVRQLPINDRREVLDYAVWRYSRWQEERQNESPK